MHLMSDSFYENASINHGPGCVSIGVLAKPSEGVNGKAGLPVCAAVAAIRGERESKSANNLSCWCDPAKP